MIRETVSVLTGEHYEYGLVTEAFRKWSLRLNVGYLCESADSAAQLIHHLCAFGRKQIMTVTRRDLNETIRNAEKLISRLSKENRRRRAHLADETLTVVAYRGQTTHALMDLATDAKDEAPLGGTLT